MAYAQRSRAGGSRQPSRVALDQVCGKGRAYAIRPYACDEAGYF